MPGALVAIHVDGEAPRRNVEAMLSACNEVAEAGSCVSGADLKGNTSHIDVSVRWGPRSETARIVVVLEDHTRKTRELSFAEEDELRERWRSVGLTIGVVSESARETGEAAARDPRETAERADAAPPDRSTEPASPAPWQRSRWWVDVGALAGPAFERGFWRFGAALRGWYRPVAPPILLTASGAVSRRPAGADGITVDFASASVAGALAFSPFDDAELRLHTGPVLQVVAARRPASGGAPSATGTAVDLGWGIGINGAYSLADGCALVVGVEGAGTTKDTVVRSAGEVVGRVPPWTMAITVGARLTAPDG